MVREGVGMVREGALTVVRKERPKQRRKARPHAGRSDSGRKAATIMKILKEQLSKHNEHSGQRTFKYHTV